MHMARMAAQLCTPVTIYTNGSEQLAKDVMSAVGENSPFKVDSRPIKKLARSGQRRRNPPTLRRRKYEN